MTNEVPEDRCGFTLEPENFPDGSSVSADSSEEWHKRTRAVCCWRESWDGWNANRCIWHADVEKKPLDELTARYHDHDQRLDGAILRRVEAGDSLPLTGTMLRGADLSDAHFSNADLSDAFLVDANLSNTDLWHVDFTNTYLTGANLTDAHLPAAELIEANLSEADLTEATLIMTQLNDAYLVNAELIDADLRNAILTNARFLGADLTGAAMSYTALGEFRFNEGTTFGGQSQWEIEADAEATEAIPYLPWSVGPLRCLGRPFTDPDDLKQAELQYRATQRLLRENDLRQLPELAVREKHVRRKRALAENNYWTWLKLAFYRWPLGYGEQIKNVIAFSAVVIVSFALVYPLVGGMKTTSQETTPYTFGKLLTLPFEVPEWAEILGANLYFSVVTFTTLGYGDIQPASPTAQALAGFESLIGALLIAFLVFVLGRRTTW